jgi:small-conductance mechanosensitive channel/CRP-like cAMP-binding protein
MEQLVPWIIEGLVLLGIMAISSVITAPLRPRKGEKMTFGKGRGAWLRILVAHVVWPLVVIVMSQVLYLLLNFNEQMQQWLIKSSPHMTAWFAFWWVVLTVRFMEGLFCCFFSMRGKNIPLPALLRSILRGAIIILAAFVLMRNVLGFNIAPLLASTALVTAVVGFALQGVLGNLLAGMSMHIVRSAVPGDWINVDDDVEGEVIETNWRETRLRTVDGHVMIVPNSRMASSVIHNLSWPNAMRRHVFEVGASYSDAPGDVIDALVTAAREARTVLSEPYPTAYVTEYKDFGINYQLRYWSQRYQDRTVIDGEVARLIWYEFKRRGIEIPFPMSDKLLNDFMAVVYRQRRMPPEKLEGVQRVRELMNSDFGRKLLVDKDGQALVKEEELLDLASDLRRVRYTRGEVIFRQGDEGDVCYVVVAGYVEGQVEYEDATRAHTFELGAGAVLGEMSLTTGLPRTATITARNEVELLEIPPKAFKYILGLRPEIPEILSALVAERAASNAAAFEDLKSLPAADMSRHIEKSSILGRFLRILGK